MLLTGVDSHASDLTVYAESSGSFFSFCVNVNMSMLNYYIVQNAFEAR